MSRIAFFSLPAYGHTNPAIGVARALTARGHQVVYYSFEMFRQRIEAAGARFVPCDDVLPPPPKDLNRRIGRDFASLIELAADTTLSLEDRVCRDLTDWGAEAVVSDSLCLWGKLFAKKLRLPCICSTTTFAFNRETAKALRERRSPGELLYFFTGLPRIGRKLRQLRQHGYPVQDPALLFANDDETDTIVYTSRLFQPMGETFSDRYAFIGPVLRCPPRPEEEKSRPVVYISMGSVLHSEPFFQSCMEALGNGRYEVRMAVGRETDTHRWHIPESVTVLPWADQLRELSRADVFLSHAGMNSVSESLYCGVPLVLCPQQSEQRTVADRTAELGTGIVLPNQRPDTIRAAVKQVLGDKSYRESAARIAESFRQSGGAEAGAEKILQVIAAQQNPNKRRDPPMTDRPIDRLITPCGEITVTDGAGRRLPFSLRENPYSPVYRLFCGTRREEALRPTGNCLLCIPTGALTVGHTYALRLRGCPLRFGSSDEHTEAISGTSRGYSIAIGAYDPNDEEKIRQAVQNCETGAAAPYDESTFVRYALSPLPDGYSFRLIDHSAPEVVFAVAWIKNGRSAPEDYEAAVEFWTT